MNSPRIEISFDEPRHAYRSGDVLGGQYMLHNLDANEIAALEVSVLWHTEGKGDEDLSVHLFKRFSMDDGDKIDPLRPGRFSTQLPKSPLSYDGTIVKIRWCVRVRAFLRRHKEIVGELPFQLGHVEPGRPVSLGDRVSSPSSLDE